MNQMKAFTMAEILLSLTIIGVVAAITLPSLMANINERTWNTQRKALHARMAQAIAMMPSVSGYGTLTEDSEGNVTEDTATEAFLTEGLAKVLKINNICDNAHLADCGIPTTYTTMAGSTTSMPSTLSALNPYLTSASFSAHTTYPASTYKTPNTKAAAFETQNGESVLAFYNPYCIANRNDKDNHFSQPYICANFIYDLNGNKGPNTVGKDLGNITVLYAYDSDVVAPLPFKQKFTDVVAADASTACTTNAGVDYRIPTKEEIAALFANRNIIDTSIVSAHLFSSSKTINPYTGLPTNWLIVSSFGEYRIPSNTAAWDVLCVKRN